MRTGPVEVTPTGATLLRATPINTMAWIREPEWPSVKKGDRVRVVACIAAWFGSGSLALIGLEGTVAAVDSLDCVEVSLDRDHIHETDLAEVEIHVFRTEELHPIGGRK